LAHNGERISREFAAEENPQERKDSSRGMHRREACRAERTNERLKERRDQQVINKSADKNAIRDAYAREMAVAIRAE